MNIRLIIYYSMYLLAFLVTGTHNALTRKKLGLSGRNVAILIISGFLFGILGAVLMGTLYNKIIYAASHGALLSTSRFRFFGTILGVPVAMPFFLRKCGLTDCRYMDMAAVNCSASLGIVKIGCAVYGCCYGIPCSCGVYNRFADMTVFPVQLLECAVCLVSAGVLLFLLRKNMFTGYLYPVFMIEYSVLRFFIEFLRYYEYDVEGNILFGLSVWQVFCILTAVLGLLQIAIKSVKNGKNTHIRI